jgi:hypothetical protein
MYVLLPNLLDLLILTLLQLEEATEQSVRSSSNRHESTSARADREIERMNQIMARIDKLEEEFARVKRLKEVVKRLRLRVETTEARYERHSSTQHSSNHQHQTSHQSQAAKDRDRYDRHR